jgi:hypothetical protein
MTEDTVEGSAVGELVEELLSLGRSIFPWPGGEEEACLESKSFSLKHYQKVKLMCEDLRVGAQRGSRNVNIPRQCAMLQQAELRMWPQPKQSYP